MYCSCNTNTLNELKFYLSSLITLWCFLINSTNCKKIRFPLYKLSCAWSCMIEWLTTASRSFQVGWYTSASQMFSNLSNSGRLPNIPFMDEVVVRHDVLISYRDTRGNNGTCLLNKKKIIIRRFLSHAQYTKVYLMKLFHDSHDKERSLLFW